MLIRQEQMNYDFAKLVIGFDRNPMGWVSVDFADGVADLPIQLALLHLPVWEVVKKIGLNVYKKHVLHDVAAFSKSSFIRMLTKIYLEYCIEADPDIADKFLWGVWECINDVDDFGTIELAEHHGSLGLIDLCEIVTDPVLADVVYPDLDPKYGTDVLEMKMADARNRLCKFLGTRGALKNESLLDYQQAGVLNANQIPQVMIAFGLRTEPNDIVIPRPVMGSALSGMRDIIDLSIEQQGARKAAIMNHEAIKASQYWGRKLHLLVCDIAVVYPQDCGSTLTLSMELTEEYHKNFIGKYIVLDDGKTVALTEETIGHFIGTTVRMRTVMGCRHKDGVCKYCAGLVTSNIAPGINMGINSAATLVSQVSQMILSTKHLIKTLSQIYQLPILAQEIFERREDGIHLLDVLRKSQQQIYLGIHHADFDGSHSDLLQLDESMSIPEERFSNVKTILVKDAEGVMKEYELVVDGQTPFLTNKFLFYMKNRYRDLTVDENVLWVPIDGMPNIPMFRTAIINDSMFAYVKGVIRFLENGMLTRHKTCGSALKHFCELAWSKVPKINILHLEVILRAHMVTNDYDWSIPVINNVDDVTFGKTVEILQNRTYSSFYALEDHKKIFSSPSTYVVPRDQGTFDQHFDLVRIYNKRQR